MRFLDVIDVPPDVASWQDTFSTCVYAVDDVDDVEFTSNSPGSRLVLAGGALSEYIVVGRNRRSPLGGCGMAMRINSSRRGI